jgi:DNA-binding LacI/PurR family transcriptional regulator
MRHSIKHATIVDIAKKLGISASTVSRSLSDHPGIKRETKELVKKVAKELRYIPNPNARNLKSNRATTIGVMVPQIKHDFFSSAISGIEEVANQYGYTIIVCQSNESYEREVLNTSVLTGHRVAGIIVSISQKTRDSEHFQELVRRNIPLVFFDRICEDVKASKVVIDDYKSAFDAVTYLINKGYKKIVHFAGPKDVGVYEKRLKGYTDAILNARLPFHEEFIIHAGLDVSSGYESMDSLFKSKIFPDAIFTVNDPVALGACKRIKEAGLKIPNDVAAIGFSNNVVSSVVDPPLTTIDQFPFEMGKKAAELLIQMIKDNMMEPKTLVLDTKLVIRGST